jgi:hypothetical protein
VELCTVQILINAKLQIGKRGKKSELTRKSPLWRGRSALDCSAIEGGGRGGGGEEEEEDFHLMPRLGMSGAMSLLPQCALYLHIY